MKNKWWIAGTLIFALLGLCVVMVLIARNTVVLSQQSGMRWVVFRNDITPATADETKNLETAGPVVLSVNNQAGNVKIVTGADGQVKIEMHKTAYGANQAEAEQRVKELQPGIRKEGNQITIEFRTPETVVVMGSARSDTIDFTITVPAETMVTASTSFGELDLSGTTGEADLHTEFGTISVAQLTGALNARTNSGDITATDITARTGGITLKTEFGEATLQRASGKSVSVSSNSGTIDLEDVWSTGVIEVQGEFGSVSLHTGSAEDLIVETNSGRITIEEVKVKNTVKVDSQFGDLSLTGVTGTSYDLRTNNGAIALDGAQGQMKIQSEFGNITIRNAGATALDIQSNNGSVEYSGTLGNGPHSIATQFGTVTLYLPEDTQLDVELQTEMGSIKSEIPLTISGDAGEHHMTGTTNGGGASLTVETNSGDIRIKIQN